MNKAYSEARLQYIKSLEKAGLGTTVIAAKPLKYYGNLRLLKYNFTKTVSVSSTYFGCFRSRLNTGSFSDRMAWCNAVL